MREKERDYLERLTGEWKTKDREREVGVQAKIAEYERLGEIFESCRSIDFHHLLACCCTHRETVEAHD